MSKLEDLPIKIILSYLNLNDLLRCRLVSKNFLNYVSHVRLDSLFADGDRLLSKYDYSDTPRYFYTNDLIDYSTRLSTSNMKFFKSNVLKTILSEIKRLYIEEMDDHHESVKTKAFNLENLNQLSSLEHLELSFNRIKRFCCLSLTNLRILHIERLGSCFEITLDTPNLFAFKSSEHVNENQVTFRYTEKMTYFSIVDSKIGYSKFVNLNYLSIDSLRSDYYQPKFSSLSRLKELYFQEITSNMLNEIWEERAANHSTFKVYLGGFKVDSANDTKFLKDELSDKILCFPDNLDFSEFISTNYTRTCDVMPCNFVHYLNYNTLFKNFQSRIPDDFYSKVIYISKVVVSDCGLEASLDQKLFAEFLRKSEGLSELDIKRASLDQQFFDDLKLNSPLLRTLKVRLNIGDLIDYKFLLKLKNLRTVQIEQSVCLDLVHKAFNTLEFLRSFQFFHNRSFIDLNCYNKQFKINFIRNLKIDDLDSLIAILKKQ